MAKGVKPEKKKTEGGSKNQKSRKSVKTAGEPGVTKGVRRGKGPKPANSWGGGGNQKIACQKGRRHVSPGGRPLYLFEKGKGGGNQTEKEHFVARKREQHRRTWGKGEIKIHARRVRRGRLSEKKGQVNQPLNGCQGRAGDWFCAEKGKNALESKKP